MILASDGGNEWVALAQTPTNATTQFIAFAGGNPTTQETPAVSAYLLDGGIYGSNDATAPCADLLFPRAVTTLGSTVTVLGSMTSSATWGSCNYSSSGAQFMYVGSTDCSGSLCANQPVDIMYDSVTNSTYALAGDDGTFVLYTMQTSAWNQVQLSAIAAHPYQLGFNSAGSVFVLAQAASPGSTVYNAGGSPFSAFTSGETLTTFDIDIGSHQAYLGGDGGEVVEAIANTPWVDAGSSSIPAGDVVNAISARGGNRAYLSTSIDGALHVTRVVTGAQESQDLPGTVIAPLAAANNITQAGRQIAITSAGSVFFVTSDGAWYWPYP